jgi:DNA polymerase I-like protein with 3'-5' exonuclease and polymerase domains
MGSPPTVTHVKWSASVLIGKSNFEEFLSRFTRAKRFSFDCETTGLRPYHGDRLFSIAFADAEGGVYLNFQAAPDIPAEYVLTPAHLARLQVIFNGETKLAYAHNFKFDQAFLAVEGVEVRCISHCTRDIGLVEFNEHQSYDLASSLARIGLAKDDAVEKWIEEQGAWGWVEIPGRKARDKNKFYTKVPFDIISAYAIKDAVGAYVLGETQVASIEKRSAEITAQNKIAKPVSNVMHNERRLSKTVFAMERAGVFINPEYCRRAAERERGLVNAATQAFEKETGKAYKSSPVLFKEVFAGDSAKWEFNKPTKTGQVNPSFESDVLQKFSSPAARHVLDIREHDSRWKFYTGFLYHADASNRVHPNFNSAGACHGRFSSSAPNFQNLTSENVQVCLSCKHEHEEVLQVCEKCGGKDLAPLEWIVRRAIVPPPGYFIASFDYKAMEYYFMLIYACKQTGYLTPLAQLVREGQDVHQATADLATKRAGFPVTRRQAKTSNFLTLYGGGDQKLADQLGIPLEEARAIRRAILDGAPEIGNLIRQVTRAAEQRGYIRNWFGRICYFPDTRWAYRATNYLIAGGCADVVKLAMNRIADLLRDRESYMVLTVHDELDFYIKHGQEDVLSKIMAIMENAFEAEYLPLKCSLSVSKTSLADLEGA